MAVAVRPDAGAPVTPAQLETLWKERIGQARDYRKQFEPTWLSNLAFAAGQMWLAWDVKQKRMRHLSELDPRYADRELYTADRINEQRQAQLGELTSGDDRQQLLPAQEGDSAEALAREINAAVAYAWEHEWRADQALTQARMLCLDLGTAAIRCRFDSTLGPTVANVPVYQGQPVLDPEHARELMAGGPRPDVQIRTVHEGRTVWEPLSSFNLLIPPGATHEDHFPWEIVVRPVLLEKVREEYGAVADSLQEDTDIASVIGLSTSQMGKDRGAQFETSTRGRLRGHVWLFTAYTRPNRDHPNGQVATFASNQVKLMKVDDQLEYVAPDQTRRTGIHYFHWWRLNDRFFSRAFIEPMKDPQRLINRRETQNAEIIDRGMPKVFTKEGAIVHNPQGLPLENIELSDTALEPHFFAGIGPGAWMYDDIEHHVENLAHASTLSSLRLGENPQNVDTYAQLALLNENESGKRSTIRDEHQRTITGLMEDSVWDIRRYWPAQKMILVTGDEDTVAQQTFEKAKIPDFYVVKAAKGSTQPRSQGAELTKIDAIWAAAQDYIGAVDPATREKWVRWYAQSLDAGEALDLPEPNTESQSEVAAYENFQMLQGEEVPQPADHDLAAMHLPIHYEAIDHARVAGDGAALARLKQHVDLTIQMAVATRKSLRVFDPADVQDNASDTALDEDQALRENGWLLAGEPPLNPEAMQQAQAAIAQGKDPDTGAALPAGVNVQAILLHASLKPTLTENLQVHLDRHGKVIKSKAFASWPAQVRARFFDHFNQTRDLFLSLPMMPAEIKPPQVTLSLRESVGPSTIADVLRRAGVPEADAQTIATEPPLENMIKRDDPPASADQSGQHYEPRGPL